MYIYETPELHGYIADINNYLILVFLLFYFLYKKSITKFQFNCLLVSTTFCFLCNYLFFDFYTFPDQNKYFGGADRVRDEFHGYLFYNTPFLDKFQAVSQLTPSIIFAIIPMPFVETINSLSFFNKFIFICFIIFFIKNKIISDKNIILFVFYPSILLYSSLSLKDNIVLISVVLSIYFLINNKIKISSLFLLILLGTKPYVGFFTLYFFSLYLIFKKFDIYLKNNYFIKFISILILQLLIVHFFFGDIIIQKINHHIFTFWEQGNEEGNYIYYENLDNLYLDVPKNMLYGLFELNYDYLNTARIILLIENSFTILIIIFLFKKYYKILGNKLTFWFMYFMITNTIFSFIVTNPGTFGRYKYPILFAFVFATLFELKKYYYEKK